jgi:hypothetical protein
MRSYTKKKKNQKQINVYMNQEDILNDRVKQSKKEKKNFHRHFENEMNKYSEEESDRDSLY